MKICLILVHFLFFNCALAETSDEEINNFKSKAKIILLNKVTATSTRINLKLDEFIKYDDLEIKLVKCWQNPLEEFKESKMLIKIRENSSENEKKIIYYNWMFTLHPAINSLQHSVYDILPIICD